MEPLVVPDVDEPELEPDEEPPPPELDGGGGAGVEILYVTPDVCDSMLLSSWPLVTTELPVKVIAADPLAMALKVTWAYS